MLLRHEQQTRGAMKSILVDEGKLTRTHFDETIKAREGELDDAFAEGVQGGIDHQVTVHSKAKAAALTKRFTGTNAKGLAANIENNGFNADSEPSTDKSDPIARPTRRSGRIPAGRSEAA